MKKKMKKIFPMMVMTILGLIGGYWAGYIIASKNINVLETVFLFLSFPMFYIIHIVIHEAGHGLFGKISGYKMVSYRIFSFMWVWREDGTIHVRRYKVPGTLGQCLMAPPTYEAGKFPFRLYLLGGVIANIVTSLIVGAFFVPQSFLATSFAIVGILTALTNAIPIGFNDGMSLKIASSNEKQQYLLYLQFEINNQMNEGKTYAELPEQYFQLVSATPPHTYFNDWQQFLIIARLAEKHNWPLYQEQLEILWQRKKEMISIYSLELKKEMLFGLCLTATTDERIPQIWTDKKIQAALKQPLMGNKRIKAAYVYCIEKDAQAALELITAGKNLTHRAPNLGDAKTEGQLLDWLETKILNEESTPHNQ